MPFRSHKHIFKPNGSTPDAWFKYTCGNQATGDCVFKVSSLEEIDYVMSLIKQSCESRL